MKVVSRSNARLHTHTLIEESQFMKFSLPAGIIFTFAIVLLISSQEATAQFWKRDQPLVWSTPSRDAIQSAIDLNKLVLLYFETSHCTYCRKLERLTWADETVQKALSDSYVPLKVDVEQFEQLAVDLHVRSFPTVIVMTPQGKELSRTTGYIDAEKMQSKLVSTWKEHAQIAVR